MESTVISLSRLKQSRNWSYTAHSQSAIWVEKTLSSSKYPVINLGDYTTSLTGGLTPKGAKYPDQGVIFVRVGNIQPNRLDLSDVVFIDESLHQGALKRCQLQPNDVLLAITGATFGKACVFPEGVGEANINQHIVKIRTVPELNPNYLSIFFNSEIGTKQSQVLATGGTRSALDYKAIRSFKIPLLPRSLQDQIAQIIQEAYSDRQTKLEQAELSYKEIPSYVLKELGINLTTAKRKRHALVPISMLRGGRFDFEAVVTLQDISSQFVEHEATLLREVVEQVNQRITPSEEYPDEMVNYIGLANIQSNTGELANFSPVAGKEILSSSPKFKKGDILFGRMRPYLNKVWIAEFDGVCSGEALVLRPNETKVNTCFLQALLLSQITLDQVVPLQSGSSLPRVSASDVLSVKLPIPKDLNKQKAIGEEIEKRRSTAKLLRSQAESVVAIAKAKVEKMILGEE